MKADDLRYRQASSRSFIGLAIHVALGLALLVYAVKAKDHSALTAMFYVLIGAGIWLVLAILYDQHRRERLEASEAEAFAASDIATSSVFEQGAQDLRVAAKRVRVMHSWIIPIISLVIAAALIGLGYWRYTSGSKLISVVPEFSANMRGWAVGLGVGMAFVAFLVARYASGMAKVPIWANLRAGAAASVGASLMGVGIVVAHFIAMLGPQVALQYLPVVFPVMMMALGAEILLSFVLDLYRPRKTGEAPRAAFESRVLGLAAAPDRIADSINEAINYQLGFNVTSGWAFQLIRRVGWRLAILGVLVVWGTTSLVSIQPHERALVLRFGKLVNEFGPGLHFKLPWPIDRVSIPEYVVRDEAGREMYSAPTVTGVRSLNVGSKLSSGEGPILWTNKHAAGTESFVLVQPWRTVSGAAQSSATGLGLEAVAVEVPVAYTIDDVEAYDLLGPPDMRDQMLMAVAQREMTWYLSGLTLSDVLTSERVKIAETLRQRIEAAYAKINPLDQTKPIVKVLSVGIQGVHPPEKTAQAFEDVVGSGQKYLKRLENAKARRIATLNQAVGSVELADQIVTELDTLDRLATARSPEVAVNDQRLKVRSLIEKAGGQAASVILRASADRWTRVIGERTRLTRYQGQLASYQASPALFRASMTLETLASAMADARVYVMDATAKIRLIYELQEKQAGTSTFNPEDANASGK